jgi:hypothetical protein
LKYKWEDVWVVASIVTVQGCDDAEGGSSYKKIMRLPPELSKFKNIFQVISAGDYINHAVFLPEELIAGIQKLLAGKFIEIENDKLKPSKKTIEYYENAVSARKRISIATALKIFAELLEVDMSRL